MEPQKGAVLPKEREQKQKERDDLRLLVGKNLARLGQLEGVDGEKYKEVYFDIYVFESVSVCLCFLLSMKLFECESFVFLLIYFD